MDEASEEALALVEERRRGLEGSQMEGVETQGAMLELEGARREGWMVDGAVESGQPSERPPLDCADMGAGVEVVEVTHEKERRLLPSFSASEVQNQSKLLMAVCVRR